MTHSARSGARVLGMKFPSLTRGASSSSFCGDLVMKVISMAILPFFSADSRSAAASYWQEYALSTGNLPQGGS